MAEMETKALKAMKKKVVPTPAESTKPGPTFTPAVDIFETEHTFTELHDMQTSFNE